MTMSSTEPDVASTPAAATAGALPAPATADAAASAELPKIDEMPSDAMDDLIRRRIAIDERALRRVVQRVGAGVDDLATPGLEEDLSLLRSSIRRLGFASRATLEDRQMYMDERETMAVETAEVRASVEKLYTELEAAIKDRDDRRAFDAAAKTIRDSGLPSREDGMKACSGLREEVDKLKADKENLLGDWRRRKTLFEEIEKAVGRYAAAIETRAPGEERSTNGDVEMVDANTTTTISTQPSTDTPTT
ncbi:hypothetical protein PYCC9005_005422 [Savitreella phatthalungensis]